MKRAFLVSMAAVLFSTCAFAQKDDLAQDERETRASIVPGQTGLRTVEGCLDKIAGSYVILGGAPGAKQFRIASGDVSALRGKIGYTVKAVGMVSKNDAASNQNTLYNAGTTTGVGYLTIDAQKVFVVHGNCSGGGKEWPGDHS